MAPQSDKTNPELLEQLKADAMQRLENAVMQDGRTTEARKAREEACVAILLAMREGVEFDPNNPLFQNFVRKQSWRRTMERVCEQISNLSTKGGKDLVALAEELPLVSALFKIAKNHNLDANEVAKEFNQDLWDDFYDQVPKDGARASLSEKFEAIDHQEGKDGRNLASNSKSDQLWQKLLKAKQQDKLPRMTGGRNVA